MISRDKWSKIQKSRKEIIETDKKIAIFLQLYHHDQWIDFKSHLELIPSDLYICLYNNHDKSNILKIKKEIFDSFPNANIIIVPNKGMDIGAFMYAIDYWIKSGKRYDYIIKVHSKKSDYFEGNIEWRNSLLKILEPKVLSNIIKSFNEDEIYGMAGPKKWTYDTEKNWINTIMMCKLYINEYIKRFKFENEDFSFVGGTMFFVRESIFYDFFTKNKPLEIIKDFDDGYYKEPSWAHGFERIFGLIISNSKNNKYLLI